MWCVMPCLLPTETTHISRGQNDIISICSLMQLADSQCSYRINILTEQHGFCLLLRIFTAACMVGYFSPLREKYLSCPTSAKAIVVLQSFKVSWISATHATRTNKGLLTTSGCWTCFKLHRQRAESYLPDKRDFFFFLIVFPLNKYLFSGMCEGKRLHI